MKDSLLPNEKIEEVIQNLTDLQKRFVDEYLIDFNGAEAVVRAGYNCKRENAKRIAYQLLDHPGVIALLGDKREERAKKTNVDPTYVIKKVVKTIEAADTAGQNAVVLKGCELLARHLGMFIERQEISGPNGDPIKYEQVREAADAFTSAISSLIERGGEDEGPVVIEFRDTGGA